MIEDEGKPRPFVIRLGRLEIDPYINRFHGFGLGFAVGEGVFWQSIRAEITFFVIYFGVHFTWDNPEGRA